MAEITDAGVTGTTLLEYEALFKNAYSDIDADWNVEPESPDGQQIAIWSESLALLDEQAQYAYMSRDPATAVDQALDDIATYAGVFRTLGTFSTAVVELIGTSGTTVPIGSRIRNRVTDTVWETTATREISAGVTVPVKALERGELTAAVGELAEIITPVAGWQRVTNSVAAIVGTPNETNARFRERRDRSVALPGANQVDNITAAVLDVDGVQKARVYENPDDEPDANGLKRRSIAIFVQGGDNDAVRAAIAPRKNPGCNMNRNNFIADEVSQDTTTPLGNPLNITFFRPNLIQGYVNVLIDSDELAFSEKDAIKQAIVDFANNGFTPSSGFTKRGFQIGESVPAGKFYTPVNNYVGGRGYVVSLTVGQFPEDEQNLISANFNEFVVFDVDAVTVTYANELE